MILRVLLLVVWASQCSAGFIRGQTLFNKQQEAPTRPEKVSDFSLPSRCLEDPDGDEECRRKLRELQKLTLPTDTINWNDDASQSSLKPRSFVSDFNVYDTPHGATAAPTKDMCYGNMKRYNKKFCNSEMPSVSLEPSEQPTSFPEGGNSGGSTGGDSSGGNEPSLPPTQPTVLPSAEPTVQSSDRPSISGAPEMVPSHRPSRSLFPSSTPTISPGPSISSAPGMGQCDSDCDVDEDCASGLYCFHRDGGQPVPGCDGAEFDDSRSDYCTGVTLAPVVAPVREPSDDICRIKLYWNASFYWQESNQEFQWCMICGSANYVGNTPPTCQEGDSLYIHECGWDSTYFEFVGQQHNTHHVFTTMIQVEATNLCLERFATTVSLQICDAEEPLQQWTTGDLPLSCEATDEFEVGQPIEEEEFCLTTHHHPKHGEEVELFPCTVARKDDTSLWTSIY